MLEKKIPVLAAVCMLLASCNPQTPDKAQSLASLLENTPSLTGRAEYLRSPYVTPGDRAYMVGHQDGSFPDLGWHIKGEMGGIWAHPIKLMDGFEAYLFKDEKPIPLQNAVAFTNYPMANRHDYVLDSLSLSVSRWQFVPDSKEGVVLEYEFTNSGPNDFIANFAVYARPDLRPTWLGARTKMYDGYDISKYDSDLNAWVSKDSLNPWYMLFGPNDTGIPFKEQIIKINLGAPNLNVSSQKKEFKRLRIAQRLTVPPGHTERIRIAIAGSSLSESQAKSTYKDLLANADTYLAAKRDRYAALAEQSKLSVPDSAIRQTFEWLKYNADWMIQEVPGIGTGITAGIPDYPWWFGVDSEYALRGYMAVGQDQVVYQTIRLLDSVSRAVNGNGRILHEMSSNGAVFNPGNINETPQFASLIWQVYRWNGNKEFLQTYYPTVKQGMDWLMEANDANGNGFPDGFGMMEIHGLDSEMIDVAAYTQAAYYHAGLMARELGETEAAEKYLARARDLARKINAEFWSEEFGSFADFLGTDQQALHLIEDAMVRADTLNKPWALAELQETRKAILANPKAGLRPFVLHHNWVVNTPMETGIADSAKAIRALQTARQFTNPFGMFVTGIDRDESAGTDQGSFQGSKVFSYTGAVMTLPTGVQAVAENNYGRPDEALDYLHRMARSFSYALPGSMYEVSPDYGMMVQAWNLYGFAVPIVEQFFGIDPMASQQRIRIDPQMPATWDTASLENVKIGSNSISVYFQRLPDGRIHLKVTQTQPGWRLEAPAGAKAELHPGTSRDGEGMAVTTGDVLELTYTPKPL
ncbi:glycogen debranching protein [Robiginitalea sp. M366]|uniref:alpha-L-rhamnosidase-related protein n=1 Tax=Robiginitalea aestuariiviva TaxID=3036903 RepID=UPI00240E810F|nr:glycogen debranching protein [Robiginitalea aestuariiviva]MDG1571709.1 glycogen debranching protein [Robiginitalea aestuariiviva]